MAAEDSRLVWRLKQMIPEREMFMKDTRDVAQALLGMVLVREFDGVTVRCTVTETEAYLGAADLACHTSRGSKQGRTRTMWGEPGRAYVYFVYGMHFCFNVVTGGTDRGEAVLIRGCALPDDQAALDVIRRRRVKCRRDCDLLAGPARLCEALAIDRQFDGHDLLCRDSLWIEQGVSPVGTDRITASARIGIESTPEPWRSMPLRYSLHNGG